jgi:hypothetical protein
MQFNNEKKIIYADADHLRATLDLSAVDNLWLTAGISRTWQMENNQFRRQAIQDPTVALLVRHLTAHPGESFVPRLPGVPAAFEKVREAGEGGWNDSRFAILLGCSPIAGYVWLRGGGNGEEASRLVENLAALLHAAITFRGREGLDSFTRIVEAEALSRGIVPSALWESGWRCDAGTDAVNGGPGRICGEHLLRVKSLCDMDSSDVLWMGGTAVRKERVLGREGKDALRDPTASLIWRYLLEYPEDRLLPVMPEPDDIAEALQSVMRKDLRGGKYNLRRIGQLLGCTGMSGYNWMDAKDNISGIVKRLALLMVNAIARDGRDGFERYLDTVEAEAVSRGFADLKDLFRNEWKSRKNAEAPPATNPKAGRAAAAESQAAGS